MTEGRCPGCGAPVQFSAGTAVAVVCSHCQAVVVRKDATLETYGKIARIVDTDTPFRLGLTGRYKGVGFRLVGHLQKNHGRGPWDEWYVELDDGRTGWLAESEGQLRLLFSTAAPPEGVLRALTPGKKLTLGGQPFVVEEVGKARIEAAEGELPSDVDPNRPIGYADATGRGGAFASLEFSATGRDASEPPELFIGEKVALNALGIPSDELRPRTRKVGLVKVGCPNCNGNLELRAPDQTKRVGCPYCGALLDANQGKLALLQLLEAPKVKPTVPLGAQGTLFGSQWTCIAFLVRSCTVEGVDYDWNEYLLFHPTRGFSWLVESNNHWLFVENIDAGEVEDVAGYRSHQARKRYKGQTYRWFQGVTAEVRHVMGECYWEVAIGEKVQVTEYVAPPRSISVEATEGETTHSLGTYIEQKTVREAFKLKLLWPPRGVAAAQPNPYRERLASAWSWVFIYGAAVLGLFILHQTMAAREVLVSTTLQAPASPDPSAPDAAQFFGPFDIRSSSNVAVRLAAPGLSNQWVGLDGELIREGEPSTTGDVQPSEAIGFYAELSYYAGQDSEGAWSEGSPSGEVYLSRVPAGRYSLRLAPVSELRGWLPGLNVEVVRDVPRAVYLFLAWGLLLVWPVLLAILSSSFETKRWSESGVPSS